MQLKIGSHAWAVVGSIAIGGLLAILLVIALLVASVWTYWQDEYPLSVNSHPIRTITPPMGWNSWNAFHCSPDFNEQAVKANIDRLAEDGYAAAGYRYFVMDDCWQSARSSTGQIKVDQVRFPNGIAPLAEYAHQKGLLFGIYTSAGRKTCEGRPGSYGYEQQDLHTYLDWQVDFIKLDWCGVEFLNTPQVYGKWRSLIDQSQRPIVLSIAIAKIYSAFDSQSWLWGDSVGDMWRVASDIQDDWSEMLRVYDVNSRYAPYQRAGEWNDADMLEVGNGGMTFEEYRTHFGLWAMMSSPLMIGTDLRKISPQDRSILLNQAALAINQDRLGLQGEVILERDTIQVVSKPLAKRGSRAVLIVNRGEEPARFLLRSRRLKLMPIMYIEEIWPNPGKRVVIKQDALQIKPHDSVLMIVRGVDSKQHFADLLPQLDGQVRSGNLTRQAAFDVYGIFEYDDEYQRGESIGVRNSSSIRYHLNNQCQRLRTSFEFIKSEPSSNQVNSLAAEVYLDGEKVWEYVVTPASRSAQLDLPLEGARILDFVTHVPVVTEFNTYGRWKQPIIECDTAQSSLRK